jgi:hypothetical protein
MNRPTMKTKEIHNKEVQLKWVSNTKSNKKRPKLKLVDRDKRVKAVNFVLA